jgi:hypothetical protein
MGTTRQMYPLWFGRYRRNDRVLRGCVGHRGDSREPRRFRHLRARSGLKKARNTVDSYFFGIRTIVHSIMQICVDGVVARSVRYTR